MISQEQVTELRGRYGWAPGVPEPERVRRQRAPIEVNECPDCGQRTFVREGRRYAYSRPNLGLWVGHVCPKRAVRAGAA